MIHMWILIDGAAAIRGGTIAWKRGYVNRGLCLDSALIFFRLVSPPSCGFLADAIKFATQENLSNFVNASAG